MLIAGALCWALAGGPARPAAAVIRPLPTAPAWESQRPEEAMRLTLQCQAGPSPGPRIWLLPGQQATVGRTEAADYAIPGDCHMSGRHFALQWTAHGYRLRDLGSTNGTFVNGQRVRERIVRHGDVIRAGQTQWLVQIEADPLHRGAAPAGADRRFACAPCPSGAVRIEPKEAKPGPAAALAALAPLGELHVIARFDSPLQPPPPEAPLLLNWLAEPSVRTLSPVVLAAGRFPDAAALALGWWARAVRACALAAAPPDEAVRALQLAARGQHRATAPPRPEHMIGDWDAERATQILTEADPAFAESLFRSIAAVLLPANNPAGWRLLTGGDADHLVRRLAVPPASETQETSA